MTGSGEAAPFGWGIIGTGTVASMFASDLAFAPGAHVAAVHSRSLDRAIAFSARFAGARTYDQLDAFLAEPAVDAVYVATPNSLHAEHGLRAVAAGKPVLVEKPLAMSSADALALARASQERGVFVMEAMWTRFLPAVMAARRHLAAGAVGKIRRVRAELAYHHPENTQTRFFDPLLGGGAAFDLGVYPVSLALDFLGEPSWVSGRWSPARTGVDRRAEIVLHYPEVTAEIACGFDRDGSNRFLIEGSAGGLRLDAPFLKAQRLTRYASPAAAASALAPKGRLGRLMERLPSRCRSMEHHRFAGHGLQFQTLAAMAAIRAGAVGCERMPVGESAAVLKVIEVVLSRPASPGL